MGKNRTKKAGIMGGTFNPIHLGHLLLAENARESYQLDEIIFIPSGHSYMKADNEVADRWRRYEMTKLAVEDNSSFLVSAIEVNREGNSYTYETLLELEKAEPDTEFYLIVGADSLFSMEQWRKPEAIFSSCIILAAIRGDKSRDNLQEQAEYLTDKYQARIKLLEMQQISISSTDIRKRIKEQHSVRYMLPDKVGAYIKEHHLYTED